MMMSFHQCTLMKSLIIQFDEIVNKHRNSEVWQINNNNWKLKNKVYEK